MVLTGHARKSALVLAGVVAVGWFFIIVGFGIEVDQFNGPLDGSLRYSWWMVILVTPIMLVTAVIHAILDRNRDVSAILGAITTLLSALFLTALAFLLYVYGALLQRRLAIDTTNTFTLTTNDIPAPIALQFSGSVIAGFFWVALACLSHFYENKNDN